MKPILPTPAEEVATLRDEVAALRHEVASLSDRLNRLQNNAAPAILAHMKLGGSK